MHKGSADLSRASAGPKKPKRSPGPAWRRKPTWICQKGDLGKLLFPFLTRQAASVFSACYILSFFYIFDSLPDSPPPAAIGRTGRRAETALPFRFGPLAPLAYDSSQPLGGMRLSRRESLPPQKFISHMDFSFLHYLKA